MESNIDAIRHTLAHVLASVIAERYPHAKATIGPAIDDGFYYDFDFAGGQTPGEADLKDLTKAMKKALNKWTAFERAEVSATQAKERFAGNEYKLELIENLETEGATITLYTCGGFTDLCRGGHAEEPKKEIDTDAFMLSRIAGAYWRGDETKPMLTRIYGLAFATAAELDAYIRQQEEAKKRDHRKLGAELKLFTNSPLVGAGLPLMQPRGMIVRKEIEDYLWSLHADKGYWRVWTPHIAKEDLYVTSGHAEKFGDELFRVSGKEEKFIMKPMNCPHHMQIFADNQFSYRDMPVRYFEPATVYRDEKTGQLGGLTRVRSITQDDGHLFCRVSQIKNEVSTIVGIIKEFFTTMGMMEGYWVRLSLRGPNGKYLGSDEVWDAAEAALREAAEFNDLPIKVGIDEAAFYGPKLDFMFKDAIGRQWQLSTIQCDFNLPNRFELSFTNEKGEKEQPVVIHRAISGSLERFMGVMIEHFGGAFPAWLSPVQCSIVPISEPHTAYAQTVASALRAAGIRYDMSGTDDSLGKRIRNWKVSKTPYALVMGDAEVADGTVSVEHRELGKVGVMPLADFVAKIKDEVASRALAPKA
jgi:threonyl-tRNA synthetase